MTKGPGELIHVSKCSKNEEKLDSTRRRKASPLGMSQKDPSLRYQHTRHLSSSRDREADEGWPPWNLYSILSSPLYGLPTLPFQSSKLDFQCGRAWDSQTSQKRISVAAALDNLTGTYSFGFHTGTERLLCPGCSC